MGKNIMPSQIGKFLRPDWQTSKAMIVRDNLCGSYYSQWKEAMNSVIGDYHIFLMVRATYYTCLCNFLCHLGYSSLYTYRRG